MKHQRSATFPLPAVFSKLPPSVASFMLPSANEALLIGEGLKVFVLLLPDGSTCCKYLSPPLSPLLPSSHSPSPSSSPSHFCSPSFSPLSLSLLLPLSLPLSLPLLFLPSLPTYLHISLSPIPSSHLSPFLLSLHFPPTAPFLVLSLSPLQSFLPSSYFSSISPSLLSSSLSSIPSLPIPFPIFSPGLLPITALTPHSQLLFRSAGSVC